MKAEIIYAHVGGDVKKRTFAVHIKNLFCNAEPCKTVSADTACCLLKCIM